MGLGRLEATGGFFLLLAWLNYLDRSFLVPMAVLSCGAHELGHVFAIHFLGGSIKRIRLTACGAEIILAQPMGYWQEGVSALAGPGVNLLLALVCCGCGRWTAFAGLNLALALFNLFPAGRLDGGRALHCTLALLAGPGPADWLCGCLSGLCAAAALTGGVILAGICGNMTLLLVSLWLAADFLRQRLKIKDKFCLGSK